MRLRLPLLITLLCFAQACTQPRGDAIAANPDVPAATSLAQQCRQLVASPAHQWGPLLAAVHDAGANAEPHLITALREQPIQPGAQAAVALLGRLGGDAARAFCEEQLRDHTPLACEAALALGALPAGANATLRACVNDRLQPADVRTAAACALARHGDRELAPRFLEAIVRAGTRQGVADEEQLGIPPKSRWALERYFVKRTLQHLGHDDLARELDTDAPWPTLEALAPRIGERLRDAR